MLQQDPITGNENSADLPPTLQALSDFYRAFNTGDLDAMSLNWAQREDISMDNPVGGIKRGWSEIRAVYDRIFNEPGEVFFAVSRERGQFRAGSQVIELVIRTSRIY